MRARLIAEHAIKALRPPLRGLPRGYFGAHNLRSSRDPVVVGASLPSVWRTPLLHSAGRPTAGCPLPLHSAAGPTLRQYAAAAEVQTAPKFQSEAGATTPVLLNVGNMKCGGCSAAVKRILLQQPGIAGAAVNLLTETAVVQTSVAATDALHIAQHAADELSSKGFPAQLRSTDDESLQATSAAMSERKERELKETMRTLAFAWTLAVVCYAHHLGHFLHALGLHEHAHTGFMTFLGNPVVSGVLGAAALLGPGRRLLVDGATSLLSGAPNMNSLIALGATTSFAAGSLSALIPGLTVDPSFLEEPVMLLAFVLLGRSLEARARVRASADLTALAQLIPTQTRLLLDAGAKPGSNSDEVEEVMVPTSTVQAGDVIRVLPGEHIPVDGTVVQGRCSIDESMLTGESSLLSSGPGDAVTGGTVMYEAPVTIRATSTGSSSTLAGIGRLVADAQSREAPVQRLADVVAGRFCYGVMMASAAAFVFWASVGTEWFPSALQAVDVLGPQAPLLLSLKLAIDVLVVACPCALGLATPTAVLVASSSGARRGLLIRGGDALERLANVDTVVLDKTGTLTQGKLELTDVLPFSNCSAAELLRLAAAVERTTRHPLADAMLRAAEAAGLDIPEATSSRTETGDGVRAFVEGRELFIGTLPWVTERVGVSSRVQQTLGDKAGGTRVWVGWSGEGIAGCLTFSDALREDACDVVRSLQRAGKRVILLSGDLQDVVTAAAALVGISPEDAHGRVRPEEKAAFITKLRSSGACVAMVGDGVNDAVALSAADVGVAMGGGTDAAGEAAEVVLMGDRLGQLIESFDLGSATLNKIKQNLGLAIAYNVVGIPIAAGALLPAYGIALTPTVAAGAMACSSIAVVTNSLLLRRGGE